jgi:hypothetical protein
MFNNIFDQLPSFWAYKVSRSFTESSEMNQTVLAIVILILAVPELSFACRCEGWNEERQFDLAKTVFLAKVTSVHAPINLDELKYDDPSLNGEHGPSPGPLRIRFHVEEVVKGDPRNIAFLQTGYGTGDCGVDVRAGHSYVFFPDRWGYLSICSGEAFRFHPLNQDHIAFLDRLRARAKSSRLK